jgi:hypothetical protein
MALVSFGFSFNVLIAWAVGSISNLILRRAASRFTSLMTGSAPVPVPITSRRHFQGIFPPLFYTLRIPTEIPGQSAKKRNRIHSRSLLPSDVRLGNSLS